LAEAIFAGAICGYVMALLSSLLLAGSLTRGAAGEGVVRRFVAPTLSVPIVAVGVFTLGFFAWPALGAVLGAAYGAAGEGTQALGSPNIYFSLAVAVVTAPQAAVVCLLAGRVEAAVVALAASFVVAFGWAMPILAEAAG
jgi:hypothetical protein